MKYIVLSLLLAGFLGSFLFGSQAYALWMSSSPEKLLDQSKTILVGNVTAVTPVDVEYQSIVAKNGTLKESIGSEVMILEEYTVNVEKFLKNPQNYDEIKLRQATVSGPPGGPAKISGFKVGDRVLFYLPKDEGQTHFPMQYLPESFEIPKYCDAQSVLEQPRTIDDPFFMTQEGIKKQQNFTANIPIQFRYQQNMGNLTGKGIDVQVTIAKNVGDHTESVFEQKTHIESKPCEWTASANWNITPDEGNYIMSFEIRDAHRVFGNVVDLPFYVTTNTSNSTDTLERLDSTHTIKIFDGSPFFVSKPLERKIGAESTITFMGINFTYPSLPEIPNPGGFVLTEVTFSDGVKETLSRNDPFRTVPVFTKHLQPQAGLVMNSDGMLSLLVSANLSDVSPLKQFKSGVPAEKIACKEGQTVMLKKNTNIPLCIKNSSIEELYCRNFLDDVWNASHPICDKVVQSSITKSPTDYKEMKILSVSPENVTLSEPKPKTPAKSGVLIQE